MTMRRFLLCAVIVALVASTATAGPCGFFRGMRCGGGGRGPLGASWCHVGSSTPWRSARNCATSSYARVTRATCPTCQPGQPAYVPAAAAPAAGELIEGRVPTAVLTD